MDKRAGTSIRELQQRAIELTHPDSGAKLVLTTDASNVAMGAVVRQRTQRRLQPLGFLSKKLSLAQKKYSSYDRELLARQ